MMPDERHEELTHRKTQADNEYFIGLFNWGATPRETEIAAEEYVYFKGEMDLTEAQDHKDDRWERFKQKVLRENENNKGTPEQMNGGGGE